MGVCTQFCEKDENDKPVIENSNYKIPEEKKEEFDKTLDDLKEEYKETLDKAEKRNDQFMELMQEEVDIDFYRFKMNEMPEALLGSDLEIMFDLVDEE
jgi:uncharacterized lipoprotein YehR (DUF1307 family)